VNPSRARKQAGDWIPAFAGVTGCESEPRLSPERGFLLVARARRLSLVGSPTTRWMAWRPSYRRQGARRASATQKREPSRSRSRRGQLTARPLGDEFFQESTRTTGLNQAPPQRAGPPFEPEYGFDPNHSGRSRSRLARQAASSQSVQSEHCRLLRRSTSDPGRFESDG